MKSGRAGGSTRDAAWRRASATASGRPANGRHGRRRRRRRSCCRATSAPCSRRRRSPVAGALIGSVALLLVAAVAWTAWARVDEVVKAQGEVEPAERVKLMNHPRGGRIATLEVVDGQRVEAGQVLLTFAPEIDAKEEAELRGRWHGRLAEIAVLKAEIEGEPLQPPAELLSSRADLVAEAEARLVARREAREGQRDALQRNVEGHRAALRSAEAEIERLQSGTVLLAQQADSVRQLTERGTLPAHEDGGAGAAAGRHAGRARQGQGRPRHRPGVARRERKPAERLRQGLAPRAPGSAEHRHGRARPDRRAAGRADGGRRGAGAQGAGRRHRAGAQAGSRRPVGRRQRDDLEAGAGGRRSGHQGPGRQSGHRSGGAGHASRRSRFAPTTSPGSARSTAR